MIKQVMCRESYCGRCVLECCHMMPHRETKECEDFCQRMKVETICIEVQSAGWDIDTVTAQCGKKLTPDCKGEQDKEEKP